MQLGRTNLSGAMRNAKSIKVQPGEVFNRRCKLLVTGRAKMRAANNRVNPTLIKGSPKPFNSIDQPGMRTAEKNHQAFCALYGKGSVIGKRVGRPCIVRGASRDQVRVADFLRRPAGDFAAEINPGCQFGKFFYEDEFCSGGFQVIPAERQADVALFVLSAPEPFAEDPGVGVDTSGPRHAQQVQEPATVVIVAMAENNSVKVSDVKVEGGKIVQQGLAAAGIKQPTTGGSLQKAGKAMLAACGDRSTDRIFTDDIELQRHAHEQTFNYSSWRV